MADGFRRRWAVLLLAFTIASTVTACDEDTPEGNSSTSQEEVVHLDLSGKEECEAAGYQELTDFFNRNGIEIYKEDLQEEQSAFCSVAMVWSVSANGENEYRTRMMFAVEIFDSVSEAKEAVKHPNQRMVVTPEDHRDPPVGLESDAPAPWDGGFIWSTPDSYDLGQTEAVARTSNIVFWMSLGSYSFFTPDQCEGEHCGVLPSELTAWLHDEYLPAVAENVLELAEE